MTQNPQKQHKQRHCSPLPPPPRIVVPALCVKHVCVVYMIFVLLTALAGATTTPCNYGTERARYTYKGTCHHLSYSRQTNTGKEYIPILDRSSAHDIIDMDSLSPNAKSFTVQLLTPNPNCNGALAMNPPAASDFTVDSSKKSTSLTLSKSGATLSQYRTEIIKVVYVTCDKPFDVLASVHVYDFVWELEPDLISYKDDSTKEPHYYHVKVTDQLQQPQGREYCKETSVFGFHGYLATLTSANENNAAKAAILLSTSVWFGLSDGETANVYKWLDGPEAGQLATYFNWDSGEPNDKKDNTNDEIAVELYTDGTWNDEKGTTFPQPSLCEYGGTRYQHPDGKAFRGAARLTVYETECDFGDRRRWLYPGTCHNRYMTQTIQSKSLTAYPLFVQGEVLPDLVPASITDVELKKLTVDVTPAMCAPLSATSISSNMAKTTQGMSGLTVSGADSIQKYVETLRSVTVTPCLRPVEGVDTYNVLWRFTPQTLCEVPYEPNSNEPHYYNIKDYVTEDRTWTGARYTCETSELLGLSGYLVTIANEKENDQLYNNNCLGGWGDPASKYTDGWIWSSGPEAGQAVDSVTFSTGSKFCEDTPSMYDLYAPERPFSNCRSKWHYGSARFSAPNGGGPKFTCEYGGTESTYTFRGAVRVNVRNTQCDFGAMKDYASVGMCHTETTTRALSPSPTTNELTVFSVDMLTDVLTNEQATRLGDRITVTAAPELCDIFTYSFSYNAVDKIRQTKTRLELASLAIDNGEKLRSLLGSIRAPVCLRTVAAVEVYSFTWALEPRGMTIFPAPGTNEPHYYETIIGAKTLSDAHKVCRDRMMFGLPGYLLTVTTQQEWEAGAAGVFKHTNGVWLGVSNPYKTQYFFNMRGPEAGASLRVFSKYTPSADASLDYAAGLVSINGASWQSVSVDATHHVVCEYGGTPSRHKFRGAIRHEVVTSDCDFSALSRSSWIYKGQCHQTVNVDQSIGVAHTAVTIFGEANVKNLISDSAFTVNGLEIAVTPALCNKLTHGTNSNIRVSKTTETALNFYDTASTAEYVSLLRSIKMLPCVRARETHDVYTFSFNFVPVVSKTINDAVTGEPHYYTASSVTALFSTAVETCRTSTVFGVLNGYLMVPTSNDEVAYSTSLNARFWVGASNPVYDDYHWGWGPSLGRTLPIARWNPNEPSQCPCVISGDMENCVEFTPPTGDKFLNDVTCMDLQKKYVCEFGGDPIKSGGADFRGAVTVNVHTTACEVAPTDTVSTFRGACHVLPEVVQETDNNHFINLFDTNAVPDLMPGTTAGQVQQFIITASPALCSPFVVELKNNINTHKNDKTQLVLLRTSAATVAEYLSVITSVGFSTCRHPSAPQYDVHTFRWEFVPARENNGNQWTERVMYEPIAFETTLLETQELCRSKDVFGIVGELEAVPGGGAMYRCRFGGPSTTARNFLGTTTVRVRTVPVAQCSTSNYAYKGTCHTHTVTQYALPNSETKVQLFSFEIVPDLIVAADDSTTSTALSSFEVTASPSLCGQAYRASYGSTGPALDVDVANSKLRLTGTHPYNVYAVAIPFIYAYVCPSSTAANTQYTFAWEFMPAVLSYARYPITNEPHFYMLQGANTVTLDEAIASCHTKTLLGLRGYLATTPSASTLQLPMPNNAYDVWLGLASDPHTSTSSTKVWRWVTGPWRGRTDAPNPVPWTTIPTAMHNSVLLHAGSGARTWTSLAETALTLNKYVCEFGGTLPRTAAFRGTTVVSVVTKEVDDTTCPTMRAWSYAGVCNTIRVSQATVRTQTISPFSPKSVPKLMSTLPSSTTNTLQISCFVATVSPALCTALTADTVGSIKPSLATTTKIQLDGPGTIEQMYAAVQTVRLTTCTKAESPSSFSHDILWEYQPDVRTYMLPSLEVHYYEFVTDLVTWSDAVTACAARSMLGLRGYLATITTVSEGQIVASMLQSDSNVWIALSAVDIGAGHFVWRWGAGTHNEIMTNVAYSNWFQSSGAAAGLGVMMTKSNNKWYPTRASERLSYVCEYGGTDIDAGVDQHFRGALKLQIQFFTESESLTDSLTISGTESLTASASHSASHTTTLSATSTLGNSASSSVSTSQTAL
eukprot:PhM_4_TR9165/c0_g1_i1/m.68593